MFKRSSILCFVFATSTMLATGVQNDNALESINAPDQMQVLYDALVKSYNQNEMKTYETKIEEALRSYLYKCIEDKSNIKNTQNIEEAANDLLQYLCKESKQDEAYSTTSMSFILIWTKIINELARIVTTEQEIENLQKSTDVIKDLVEKIFLDPMNKMLEEEEIEQ